MSISKKRAVWDEILGGCGFWSVDDDFSIITPEHVQLLSLPTLDIGEQVEIVAPRDGLPLGWWHVIRRWMKGEKIGQPKVPRT